MKLVCRVQNEDFVVADEYRQLQQRDCGAVVIFAGLVRDQLESTDSSSVIALELEHYPGMTETSIVRIAEQAAERFDIRAMTIIHRVGLLRVSEQIVFVGAASPHRSSAFAACEMVMDYLKNYVPIWKKLHTNSHSEWVEAKSSDQAAMCRWLSKE